MSTFTKLPSGRIAYKQNGENSFSVYGPDDTTFITSISFEDIKELKEAADYLVEYEADIKAIRGSCSIDAIEFFDQDADGLIKNNITITAMTAVKIDCAHHCGSFDGEHCSQCGTHLRDM